MASPSTTGAVGIYVGLPNAVATQAKALTITAGGFTFPASGLGGLAATAAQGLALALSRLSMTPILLGTGMRGPRIRIRRAYSKVFNDITGPEIPYDDIWSGEEGRIFFDLTRWNESVYTMIAQRPRAGATLGAEPAFTRGTLMTTEGMNWPMYLRFPNFDSHPYYAKNGGVAGYRFLSCKLVDDDDFETGTQANLRHLAVEARDVYDPTSNGLALCDFNMTGVPAILPN